MDNSYLEHHGVVGMKWGVRHWGKGKSPSYKVNNHIKKAKTYVKQNKTSIKRNSVKLGASSVIAGGKFVASMAAASNPAIGIPIIVASTLAGGGSMAVINKYADNHIK